MIPLFRISKRLSGVQTIGLCLFSALILTACGESYDEDELSPERIRTLTQPAVQENNQIVATAGELMNVKNEVFADFGIDLSGSFEGRIGNSSDCKPEVIEVVIADDTHYDTLIYAGTLTLDYKDGSVCAGRKGKVTVEFTYIINYRGDISYSSRESITFNNFTRDTVTFNGKVLCRTALGEPSTLETTSIGISYPDNSKSTWQGKLYFDGDMTSGITNVTGRIEGLTRRGLFYEANIKSPLAFNEDCTAATPSSGVIDVRVNNALATMDYGTGQCDDQYAVTALTQAP